MSNFDQLKKAPFNLDDAQISWVQSTLTGMTEEEKIGQLFCLVTYSSEENYLKNLTQKYHVGGIMGRPMPLNEVITSSTYIQKFSKIPVLISANFEAGGDGLIHEGTNIGPNMQVGATNNVDFAAKQGYVCGREGRSVGANWAFAPVIDIERNFRNPITATRLYGSDENLVAQCGAAYTRAIQEQGVAASIKHFPGDGVDERDQHLVTSINSMSCEEWDETFGKAYSAGIEAGALTVMVGHIMLPSYTRKFIPDIKDEDIMPATLAPELINGLLREKLGFNGMIVTDATTMAGMCVPMVREKAVPYTIAAGCDMFLFTKNLDEDYDFMTKGVKDGIITKERLDQAVMRILGVKAALKLNEKKESGTLLPDAAAAKAIVGCEEHKAFEKACSDQAVTLVKNKENLLPLDVNKHKRVLLYPILSGAGVYGGHEDIAAEFKVALEKEGFVVDIFQPAKGFEGLMGRYQDMADQYDLMIYIGNMMTKSNQTSVRIEWASPMGANCPIYIEKIPTIFISFANPYHLIDAPRIKTFINAYKYKPANVNAVIDKMLGRSEFKGVSPIDPFCGMWDTRL